MVIRAGVICIGMYGDSARGYTADGNGCFDSIKQVIPVLVEQGFEVFAPDFIGFGMSDKPLARDQISFELQIRVLIRVFDEFNLRDAHILAHDWGG